MIHRHLDYAAGTPFEQLGPAALDDLLDRGDLADWAPLARAVAREPFGEVATTVERLCDAHPLYGTSPLWRAFLDRCRARAEGPRAPRLTLGDLRRATSVTQAALAERLAISQSDLSKLERRVDLRLSTLRSYVSGLGGRLRLLADLSSSMAELEIPPVSTSRSAAPRTGN